MEEGVAVAIKNPKRINDHYSKQARKDGFPARSVYKLEEFDQRCKIIKAGFRVLDLGCYPGSWSLYASQKVGSKGHVLGLDLNLPEEGFPENVTVKQADLLSADMNMALDYGPFDVVLSDMAPKTMGRKEVDQARSLELCEMAWHWAKHMLKNKGDFLFKIFQSQDGEDFIKSLAPSFTKVIRLKPKACRTESSEFFVLCQKFIMCSPSAKEVRL